MRGSIDWFKVVWAITFACMFGIALLGLISFLKYCT